MEYIAVALNVMHSRSLEVQHMNYSLTINNQQVRLTMNPHITVRLFGKQLQVSGEYLDVIAPFLFELSFQSQEVIDKILQTFNSKYTSEVIIDNLLKFFITNQLTILP